MELRCCLIIITNVKLCHLGLARNYHFIISLQMRLATLQSTRGSSYWPVPGIYDIFSTTHLSLVFQSIAPQTSNSKGNANIYFLVWNFFLKFCQLEIYLLFDKVSTYTILRALLFHFPPIVYHPPWTFVTTSSLRMSFLSLLPSSGGVLRMATNLTTDWSKWVKRALNCDFHKPPSLKKITTIFIEKLFSSSEACGAKTYSLAQIWAENAEIDIII